VNQSEYEELCQKAERLAEENPRYYRLKLSAYSLLGYVVLFGILLGLIAIVAGFGFMAFHSTGFLLLLVKKKLILVLLPVIWIMATALWVKMEKPTGHELTRDEFPELFAEIDELQRELKTPKIHQVILSDEFNASITQTPRLGVFGWQHNTLTLGLELLMSLSPAQARAVIAHELGHLAGGDSAFAARIYRSRISWQRVMSAFAEADSMGTQLMHKFFSWYAPRFSAYSFALARQNEYEADSIAARLTSANDAGSALVAVHTFHDSIIGSYWGALYKTADHLPKPHATPWKQLNDYISVEKRRDFSEQLKVAMSFSSDYSDTHPSLKQRLDNLGVAPELDVNFDHNAAAHWFGEQLDVVIDSYDAQWFENTKEGWNERYNYVCSSQDKIKTLEQKHTGDLSSDEFWNKVLLWCEFKSDEEKLQILNEFIGTAPDHVEARYIRGSHLCSLLDESGLEDLEFVSSSPELGIDACLAAYNMLMQLDQTDAANRWRDKADVIHNENHQRYLNNTELTAKDTLVKAQLSAERREEIIKALVDCKIVKKAWIAEKQVTEKLGDNLVIVVQSRTLRIISETGFVEKVRAVLPDFEGWLLYKSGDNKALAKKAIKAGERLV